MKTGKTMKSSATHFSTPTIKKPPNKSQWSPLTRGDVRRTEGLLLNKRPPNPIIESEMKSKNMQNLLNQNNRTPGSKKQVQKNAKNIAINTENIDNLKEKKKKNVTIKAVRYREIPSFLRISLKEKILIGSWAVFSSLSTLTFIASAIGKIISSFAGSVPVPAGVPISPSVLTSLITDWPFYAALVGIFISALSSATYGIFKLKNYIQKRPHSHKKRFSIDKDLNTEKYDKIKRELIKTNKKEKVKDLKILIYKLYNAHSLSATEREWLYEIFSKKDTLKKLAKIPFENDQKNLPSMDNLVDYLNNHEDDFEKLEKLNETINLLFNNPIKLSIEQTNQLKTLIDPIYIDWKISGSKKGVKRIKFLPRNYYVVKNTIITTYYKKTPKGFIKVFEE